MIPVGTGRINSEAAIRVFVLTFLVVTLMAGGIGLAAERPNILWICGDDHAAYVYGAYGNEKVRTPNLDRLAREGIRFDRAYCNSPVCTASRQSFLTGRYPRTIGVTQLATPLPEEEVTLAEILKKAGYATGAIGKMHFNSASHHGFDLRLDTEDHRKWIAKHPTRPIPEGIAVLPAWKPFKDPAAIWLNASCLPYGARDESMTGTWFAIEAERYLTTERTEPFFLMVSFTEPHSPFHFPIEFKGRHSPEEFEAPAVGMGDEWQIPEIFRGLTNAEKRGIIASYYTSAEFLDENVGRVLEALEKSGHTRDTVVIYTGDHGYMLGQHGRFEKHCSYEPAVRAPLVVRFPNRINGGRSTDAFVEFIDIVPTILDLCEIQVPDNVQGRSFAGLLQGKTDTHRAYVTVEYSENAEAMIRDANWKFIYMAGTRAREDGYATGRPLTGPKVMLFDMHNDPEEMHDLSGEASSGSVVEGFKRQLADHLIATAREPERIPRRVGLTELLDFCLQPRDVTPKPKR